MPRKDGTGPGQGSGLGRGMGMGRGSGLGAGGKCRCPKCGHKSPHSQGSPCNTLKCPHCGAVMVRE